jgi:peptidoglycan/xylan/chitin deacetylase (PgdA/CDA1 family)
MGLLGVAVVAAVSIGGGVSIGGYLPTIRMPGTPVGAAPTQMAAATGLVTVSAAPTAAYPASSPLAGAPASSAAPGSSPLPGSSGPPTFSDEQSCDPPTSIQPARVVSHGDFSQKTVALTFDDGINPENTRQILRILKREHVNATFFPTGVAMERFADVWLDVAKSGYPIANHTYGHGALAGQCYAEQRHELSRASAVFASLGIPELPVMRPPYEIWDNTTAVAATAEGLSVVVLWNVDTGDWRNVSAASIRRTALSGGRGSIILMHTFPEATAAALPGIIEGYRARGFKFVTIGQLLGIPGPVPFPDEED